jgi:hypothetical protein
MNPLFLAYSGLANLDAYAGPSAIVVTGQGNPYAPEFQRFRDKGGKVYRYIIPISVVSALNAGSAAVQAEQFMGDIAKVPLWGNDRRNSATALLTDIRVGSAWTDWHVNELLPMLIDQKLWDGVFYDVLGVRPWGVTLQWDTWPEAERQDWTSGSVDFARRTHEKRMQLDPRFEIVHNNVWQQSAKSAPVGGEKYCNGVCIEHKAAIVNGAPSFHAKYVGRDFAPGVPKRNLILALSDADAAAWATVPGATHVGSAYTAAMYKAPTPPVVPYEDLRSVENEAYIASLRAQIADQKARYDSLFALAETAVVEARNERDAAIEQRNTATSMYDKAAAERDVAAAELEEVLRQYQGALDREAAAAAAAYSLQAKINAARSALG